VIIFKFRRQLIFSRLHFAQVSSDSLQLVMDGAVLEFVLGDGNLAVLDFLFEVGLVVLAELHSHLFELI
jgi:hypothetical protein